MQISEFFEADMDVLIETRTRWRAEELTKTEETAKLAQAVTPAPQLIVIGGR